jgi:DNA-binding NarL/FixJ family response regulator
VATSAARTAILLDPRPLWLDVIEHVLQRVGVEVQGTAMEPDEAHALLGEHKPDLFIVELAAYGGLLDPADAFRAARERAPHVRIVVLSSIADPEQIDRALNAGVVAYVIKTAQSDDLASAVRQAFEASIFFPGTPEASAPATAPASEAGPLTKRELEILRLVAEGHTNADIAGRLWVTEQTVKFHLSNVYRKLGVANRTEAGRWAQLHGLLSLERR